MSPEREAKLERLLDLCTSLYILDESNDTHEPFCEVFEDMKKLVVEIRDGNKPHFMELLP